MIGITGTFITHYGINSTGTHNTNSNYCKLHSLHLATAKNIEYIYAVCVHTDFIIADRNCYKSVANKIVYKNSPPVEECTSILSAMLVLLILPLWLLIANSITNRLDVLLPLPLPILGSLANPPIKRRGCLHLTLEHAVLLLFLALLIKSIFLFNSAMVCKVPSLLLVK